MTDPLDPVRAAIAAAEDVDMGDVPVAGDDSQAARAADSSQGDPGRWIPDRPSDLDGDRGKLPPEAEGARQPLNDIGNGRRFAVYHGEDVLRVKRVAWFIWDGARWAKDPDDLAVRARAQDVSERMALEIGHLVLEDWQREALAALPVALDEKRRIEAMADRSEEDRAALFAVDARVNRGEGVKRYLAQAKKEHRTFAKSTGNSAKIDAMMREAEVALAQPLDALDADPLLVNCLSGTLRFSIEDCTDEGGGKVGKMEIGPHDRDEHLSKMMPVEHDPEANAPTWEAFLERIQPVPENRRFLQRSFGLAMSSLTVQRLWFLHGHGANGKSVLVDVIARILGDYAATAKIESLTGQSKRGGGDATPDLVPLMGARMVRASEPEQGERLKEGTIKELTGGEPILVRALHSDFVEVKPKFKLFISGNHKPDIRGTDDGIWRRMLLVPFEVQIPEAERDQQLGDRLWAERAGILNWLIDGLIQYLEVGLNVPKAVMDATLEYREESDPVGLFLDQCCEVTGAAETFTRSKDLVTAFNFWLDERGETAWQGRTIALKLKANAGRWRDPRSGKTYSAAKRSVSGYQGLQLTDLFRQRMAETAPSTSGYRGSSASAPDPDEGY